MRILLNWLLSAFAFLVVAHLVQGFHVNGLLPAMIAAVVVGFVNGTLGLALKILTFPLTFLTLGLFWWVINAAMLLLASSIVPGFTITGFIPALVGSFVLSLVNLLFSWVKKSAEKNE
jgi:putative membrane protein